MDDSRLLTLELELPLLLLVLSIAASFVLLLIALFTQKFRGYRFRLAVAPFAFAFTGFLGLLVTVRLKVTYLNNWLPVGPGHETAFELISLAIYLAGYLFFGFLGCWLATRLIEPLDNRDKLARLHQLYDERMDLESTENHKD